MSLENLSSNTTCGIQPKKFNQYINYRHTIQKRGYSLGKNTRPEIMLLTWTFRYNMHIIG